ncbi:MAG: hypothetical protein U0326_29615 [Polyangiales bacterium]
MIDVTLPCSSTTVSTAAPDGEVARLDRATPPSSYENVTTLVGSDGVVVPTVTVCTRPRREGGSLSPQYP